MKWLWWIGGALAYIVIKNEVGGDSPAMWLLLLVILVAATLLGRSADATAKKVEQEERDRSAAEAANNALQDFRQQTSTKTAKSDPEK